MRRWCVGPQHRSVVPDILQRARRTVPQTGQDQTSHSECVGRSQGCYLATPKQLYQRLLVVLISCSTIRTFSTEQSVAVASCGTARWGSSGHIITRQKAKPNTIHRVFRNMLHCISSLFKCILYQRWDDVQLIAPGWSSNFMTPRMNASSPCTGATPEREHG
eukprot:2298284-Rhodomonas_salina.1